MRVFFGQLQFNGDTSARRSSSKKQGWNKELSQTLVWQFDCIARAIDSSLGILSRVGCWIGVRPLVAAQWDLNGIL